ncbi:MAG: toll/interleukin-1 receptor domain-containing protein [Myxococcota bacterium]
MEQPEGGVFISYKREDESRAQVLAEALVQHGYDVWWDRDLRNGQSYLEQIQAQLERAGCVIVLWSTASVGPQGGFVRDEARRARERGIFVPVVIEDVTPPLGFGEDQALDLRRWNGNPSDPFFLDLKSAVTATLRGAPLGASLAHVATLQSQRRVQRTVLRGILALALVAGLAGLTVWQRQTCWNERTVYRAFIPPMESTARTAGGLLTSWNALLSTDLFNKDAHADIADKQNVYWEDYRSLLKRYAEFKTGTGPRDSALTRRLDDAIAAFEALHEYELMSMNVVGAKINELEKAEARDPEAERAVLADLTLRFARARDRVRHARTALEKVSSEPQICRFGG